MAFFRYWRVIGLECWGRGDLTLSGIHLHSGATRVDESASISCAFTPSTGAVANLQDGDTATTVTWPRASYFDKRFSVLWDFGAPQDVDDVLFGSASSQETYVMCANLQGSDDGIVWVTVLNADGVSYPGPSAMQAFDPDGDHLWDKVVLQMPFDGTNGSATFTDVSPYGRAVTRFGNAQITTATSVFGGASGAFDGSGDYLAMSGTGLNPGMRDWTIEFRWFNENTVTSNNVLMSQRTNFSDAGWGIDAGISTMNWMGPSNTPAIGVGTPAGEWHDYCFERVGNLLVSKRDGVVANSAVITANLNHSAGTFYIGRAAFTSAITKGKLDMLRITFGDSRYQGVNHTIASTAFATRGKNTRATPLPYALRNDAILVFTSDGGVGCVPTAVPNPAELAMANDAEFGGRGRIAGTVAIDSSPDIPVRRRVRLVRDRDGLLARETWSAPGTGAYEFTHIAEQYRYSTIAVDHSREFAAVVADNLTPEPM